MRKIKGEDQLEITLHEVVSRRHAHDGLRRRPAVQGRRGGRSAGRARRGAAVLRRGLPARAARVADGHRPGGPDVPRRRGRVDRGGDQARRHDRRRRAARALPGAHPAGPGEGRLPRHARRADRQAAGPRAGRVARARLGRGRPGGAPRRARARAHAVRRESAPCARERAGPSASPSSSELAPGSASTPRWSAGREAVGVDERLVPAYNPHAGGRADRRDAARRRTCAALPQDDFLWTGART